MRGGAEGNRCEGGRDGKEHGWRDEGDGPEGDWEQRTCGVVQMGSGGRKIGQRLSRIVTPGRRKRTRIRPTTIDFGCNYGRILEVRSRYGVCGLQSMETRSHFRVRCGGRSDVGGRKVNDDAFSHSERTGLCVVADGIGSHRGEGVASHLAVTTFVESFARVPGDADRYRLAAAFKQIFAEVNHTVHQRFLARDPTQRLGTTLVALAARGDGVVTGHVGDSRIYRVRAGGIERITRDHSFEKEREGMSPKKYLMRAVGTTPDVAAEVQMREARAGDLYLLCTDGLTDVAEDGDILAVCGRERVPGKVADALVGLALERRTRDNVTVLALGLEA